MEPILQSKAYNEGVRAYYDDKIIADCPYPKGTQEWRDWIAGMASRTILDFP